MTSETKRELTELGVRDLLMLSGACIAELRDRGVVRTGNAPLGDYVEWLALQSMGGELAPNSERSFDLTTPDGRRVQVKSRRVSTPPTAGQVQTSPFRSWGFDEALFVLVDATTYEVRRASLVPLEVVQGMSRYIAHVNGSYAYMTEDLMAHELAVDMTDELRAAAGDPPAPPRPVRDPAISSTPRSGPRRPLQPITPGPGSSLTDWIWLGNGAIEEFKAWRLQRGASSGSASSYATGARAFVRYCRSVELDPSASVDSFAAHLQAKGEVSARSIASYETYARAFVEFLESRGPRG